jgi:CRP/FNR family transcriptional regulator, cyclic AMP receptor protein
MFGCNIGHFREKGATANWLDRRGQCCTVWRRRIRRPRTPFVVFSARGPSWARMPRASGVTQFGKTEARALRLMVADGSPTGVDPLAVADVAQHWQLVHFAKAEQIYAQGDAADRLYIVVSGDVKLSRTLPFGRTVLTLVGPREMFGALSLFDPGPRTASATALSEVWAGAIDHEIIRAMVHKHPPAAEQLLQMLARRLKRTDEDLADLVFTDSKGRVAKRLLQLARRIGTPEEGALRVVLHLTRAEIGQLAGVGREEVSKTMAEFARRGWIKVDGPSVLIRRPERLARRAR